MRHHGVVLIERSQDLLASCSGSARGVSGIPVYPKKIRQNTKKYPKFIQIYPKLIKALYTVYLKLVVSEASDIPNTRI